MSFFYAGSWDFLFLLYCLHFCYSGSNCEFTFIFVFHFVVGLSHDKFLSSIQKNTNPHYLLKYYLCCFGFFSASGTPIIGKLGFQSMLCLFTVLFSISLSVASEF